LYDFKVENPGDFTNPPIAKSFFDAYDSDKLRYLHVRTKYADPSSASGYAFSDDVVTVPIRIDNVAPTGTITLNPTGGNSRVVVVSTMSPSESIKYYWLSDSATFPGGTGIDYSLFPSGSVEITEGTSYGNVTIYAWFQDQAGNRSTAATASAVYAYSAPTSIQHTSSSMNVDATLGFTVDGSTTYTWTITDPSVTGVAVFSGSSGGVSSVTVIGNKAGTFTVTATPSSGTALKTGTITVVQTSTSKEYGLITTGTTSVNAIVLSRSGTGYTKASQLFAAVPNCDGLSRWSATAQAYDGYDNIFGTNDFDLVVGEPYFVSVNNPGTFTVAGSVPAVSYPLLTTSTTNVNAISLPQSKASLTKASQLFADIPAIDGLSRWSATAQAYDGYDNIFGTNDFTVSVDEAYFVSVSSPGGNWP
jgi:hypothetical protein